jgi:hypothetical protein
MRLMTLFRKAALAVWDGDRAGNELMNFMATSSLDLSHKARTIAHRMFSKRPARLASSFRASLV